MAGGGASVGEFSLPEAGLAQSAWHILMSAETCSNLSRYDGIKFGYRTEAFQNLDELYTKSRTEAFSLLTKALILYGSDVLSKGRYEECYDKSLRVRRALRDKLSEIFRSYDCIIAPACSKSAYRAEMLGDSIDAAYDESFSRRRPAYRHSGRDYGRRAAHGRQPHGTAAADGCGLL